MSVYKDRKSIVSFLKGFKLVDRNPDEFLHSKYSAEVPSWYFEDNKYTTTPELDAVELAIALERYEFLEGLAKYIPELDKYIIAAMRNSDKAAKILLEEQANREGDQKFNEYLTKASISGYDQLVADICAILKAKPILRKYDSEMDLKNDLSEIIFLSIEKYRYSKDERYLDISKTLLDFANDIHLEMSCYIPLANDALYNSDFEAMSLLYEKCPDLANNEHKFRLSTVQKFLSPNATSKFEEFKLNRVKDPTSLVSNPEADTSKVAEIK